jgi:hypothetical protein
MATFSNKFFVPGNLKLTFNASAYQKYSFDKSKIYVHLYDCTNCIIRIEVLINHIKQATFNSANLKIIFCVLSKYF